MFKEMQQCLNFPPPCPKYRSVSLEAATAYYQNSLGFTVDWSADELGLAASQRATAACFLPSPIFERSAEMQHRS
jgi:hypothetical protein